MAGRCLPEQPDFTPERRFRAERVVWEAVRRKLGDQDVLLHGVRFVGDDGDWEVDLILLTPEGFAVIEVKGGQVWYADGAYHQRTTEGVKIIDLDEQALSEKYLVRRYLTGHRRWNFGAIRMAHFVALPDMTVGPDDDFGPGLPPDRIISKGNLPHAIEVIGKVLRGPLTGQPNRVPGAAAVDLAAGLLGGRGDAQRDVAGMQELRADHVRRLTDEQAALIDVVALLPRYQVVGGPGSGKTFLAIEQARRWAEEGCRVGFVAYSLGLTTWVHRLVASWPAGLRNRTDVSTFHALGRSWGATVSGSALQVEWDRAIPGRMAELAASLPTAARYDALIVDEAQDFGAHWWPALLAALHDPDHGRLAVFGDAAQRVFDREGAAELDLPPLQLTANLRNSDPIGSLVNAVRPGGRMALRGGSGPAVRFLPCGTHDAVGVADDAAVQLLDEGWAPQDVALLTTGHRHPMQRDIVDRYGREGYWKLFWDDGEIFYATVAGFKGLERPAVVLAINGFIEPSTARDNLLVGISRARDQLVVCGDPQAIGEVGGEKLAERLGFAS